MLKYFPILFKPSPSVFKYVQTSCKPTLAVLQDFDLFPIMFKPSSPIFKCLNSVQANPGGFRRFSKMFQFCANHTPRFSDLSEFCSSHGGSKRFPRFPNCLQTTHLGLEIFSNSVRANHGGSQ